MCTKCIPSAIDEAKAGSFADKFISDLNGAANMLMISIGHRTGLFDAMSAVGAATSVALARHAGLDERYVREWLNAMTTGRVVEFDPASGEYVLPPEHAQWLTRGGTANLAGTAQWVAVLASVEDRVTECFRKGGGVGYEHYNRFHEVMAEETRMNVVRPLLDVLLPLVPELRARLESGIRVLDLGCGVGEAITLLAREFPRSEFVGYDFYAPAIAKARASTAGLPNLRFEVRDAAAIDDTSAFDVVFTFDSVHDQAVPQRMLDNIHRALKPGGVHYMVDIGGQTAVEANMDWPLAPFMYAISCMHCMSVSLAADGAGLGAMWGRQKAREMLDAAGFASVQIHSLEHDIMNAYFINRKAA